MSFICCEQSADYFCHRLAYFKLLWFQMCANHRFTTSSWKRFEKLSFSRKLGRSGSLMYGQTSIYGPRPDLRSCLVAGLLSSETAYTSPSISPTEARAYAKRYTTSDFRIAKEDPRQKNSENRSFCYARKDWIGFNPVAKEQEKNPTLRSLSILKN